MNTFAATEIARAHAAASPDERVFARSLADAHDQAEVGGKASTLARLLALGAPVPGGGVLTCAAFDRFLHANGLAPQIDRICADLNPSDLSQLQRAAEKIRGLVTGAPLPPEVDAAIETIATELLPGARSRVPAFESRNAESGIHTPEPGTRNLEPGPRTLEPWNPAVAVRSSAVGEDGERTSFAGQLDSILGVTTREGLREAVRVCWASYRSERALFYRSARGATLSGMGVIVQQQVDAAVAGVLFTREPVGGAGEDRDDLLIEYCAGLGEALVSGRVDPGRLRVSRGTLTVTTLEELSDEHDREIASAALTPQNVRDLARLSIRPEQDLSGPQDIEWAIGRDGTLSLLQARPITTLAPGTQRAECEDPASPKRDSAKPGASILWSNANVNENFPDPISPLLYSIASLGYYHYFRNLGLAFGISRRRLAAMDRPLRTIIGVHGARMYYNLTNIHAVLRMAPFGDRLTAAFNQFVGASETAASPDGAASWTDRRRGAAQALELMRVFVSTTWQYVWLRRRLESFERTADDFASRTHPDALADRRLPSLLEHLGEFLDIRFRRWKNASLTDAAAMVSYALLQRSLARAGAGAIHNRLLRALPGVPSSTPPLRLWALSRQIRADQALRDLFATAASSDVLNTVRSDARFAGFRRSFELFLDEWGFRSSSELMLTVPGLQEQPEPVIELLKQYAESEGEPPEAAIARQAAERMAETSRLLRGLAPRSPIRAAFLWRLLTWTQRSVAYRERARLKQALLYTRCRRIALAIGARLVETSVLERPEDVFFLSWQEIDELGSGRAMFPYRIAALVAARQREHAALSAMRPPDTIRAPEGTYLPLAAAPRPAVTDEATSDANGGTLAGLGACGGTVTARAAVLEAVTQAHRLVRGDILVTRQTDPGWGPIFLLVSGLVIERGGMLSHGAIIAREFGLPCVIGIKDATRRIAHGARITVDGDRGTCAILDTTPETGSQS